MKDSKEEKSLPISEENRVVISDASQENGQDKCPKCGATEITLNMKSGLLRCNYCRHEFEPVKLFGLTDDISSLKGRVQTDKSENIASDETLITLKCQSCGADVVIESSSSTQARCHWCRNALSLNAKVPNGASPDVVLPFRTNKAEAKEKIKAFVNKRSFYANTTFKNEFTTENIMGVYLPYMVVDINSKASLSGVGEIQTRAYMVGDEKHRHMEYDADSYKISRDFDLTIHGLTVESSADKLKNSSALKTNNVINAIMPFDIENCVKFNSNYLTGFTSEKRDTDINDLKDIVTAQSKDIARFKVRDSLKKYNRGVRWENEEFVIIGDQWKTAYLPVWLYSYQEVKSENNKVLHYVALNARTNETMGSVPLNAAKLFLVSLGVEFFGLIMMLFVDSEYSFLFLILGFVYYFIIQNQYRNSKERHKHELETQSNLTNMKATDNFMHHHRGLRNSQIHGKNNDKVTGSTNKNK